MAVQREPLVFADAPVPAAAPNAVAAFQFEDSEPTEAGPLLTTLGLLFTASAALLLAIERSVPRNICDPSLPIEVSSGHLTLPGASPPTRFRVPRPRSRL
jgi:hypothetical protein